jgi:phage antirepressor YoqD-like protein
MNQLIAMSSEMTMGTREIAEMLGAKHGNIKVSAERLYDAGALTAALKQSEFDHNGNTYFEYLLNKMDSITLVAQNCPRFTAALVKRWDELERGVSKPSFMDSLSPAAVIMLEDLDRQLKESKKQLAIAAPKAEFVDRYVQSTGNLGFRQVAKLLKVKENEMREFLISNRVMYRLAGSLTPYAEHIDAGRFEVNAGMAEHGDTSHAYQQAKFTPKGVEWLAGELAKADAKKQLEVM